MLRLISVILFICLVGFFDSVMDMIKDFKHSNKNWLYQWCSKHPEYLSWYEGYCSIPFFKNRGYQYNPGKFWLSDAWHMAKHGMLLSVSGAVACSFGTCWYYQIVIWWLCYYLEGEIFNLGYQRLK
jgi:hypothetical protein